MNNTTPENNQQEVKVNVQDVPKWEPPVLFKEEWLKTLGGPVPGDVEDPSFVSV